MTPELISLMSAAVNRDPLPEDVQSFIKGAVMDWLEGGITMDQALGLAASRPGERSASARLLTVLRNGRLADAEAQLGLPSRRRASIEIERRLKRLSEGGKAQDRADEILAPIARLHPEGLGFESIRRVLRG